jgi:hypothetical protein
MPLPTVEVEQQDLSLSMVVTHTTTTTTTTQHHGDILNTLGPPCTDVSSLRGKSKPGAMGEASRLRRDGCRVVNHLRRHAPGRTIALMECTPMSDDDLGHYIYDFNGAPTYELDSVWWTPAGRRRWWWFQTPFQEPMPPDCTLHATQSQWVTRIQPRAHQESLHDIIEPGFWPAALEFHIERQAQSVNSKFRFRCLTRHRQWSRPPSDPRGIQVATPEAVERWAKDDWAQSPYQYALENLLITRNGDLRRMCSIEEARIQGLSEHFLQPLNEAPHLEKLTKTNIERKKRSLLGNGWNIYAARFWFRFLVGPQVFTHQVASTAPPTWQFPLSQHPVYKELFPILHELQGLCPYNFEQKVTDTEGPHWSEMNMQNIDPSFAGVQTKRQGFAASRTKLIPHGLPADLHYQLGSQRESPLAVPPILPPDTEWAVDTICQQHHAIRP